MLERWCKEPEGMDGIPETMSSRHIRTDVPMISQSLGDIHRAYTGSSYTESQDSGRRRGHYLPFLAKKLSAKAAACKGK